MTFEEAYASLDEEELEELDRQAQESANHVASQARQYAASNSRDAFLPGDEEEGIDESSIDLVYEKTRQRHFEELVVRVAASAQ